MNLFYLAQNGLSAAQAALNVVGNNLANATTDGYSRQNIMLGEAGGLSTVNGFFGYGVKVDDVQRMYDGFMNNQVRSATTEYSSLSSQYDQVSQIDDMIGDGTNNISSSLDNMFSAMEGVSKDPVDPAARQSLLSQFSAIASQFRSNSKTLNGLEKNTNTQINQSVDDINSCTKQLSSLNEQISKIHAQTGGVPADLMDQRDQLLSKLSEQIGITVNENKDTGCVDVSMGNGMSLVNGSKSYSLQTSTSDKNPNQTVVSYVDSSGNVQHLDDDSLTGKLGGLFKFRNTDLVDARNQLNQLALKMANKFNEVNAKGYDRNGAKGGDIFNVASPQAIANASNSGSASLDVDLSDVSAVKAEDYTVTYDGANWQVTTRDGRKITPTVSGGKLTFEGITITPTGVPKKGDSFSLNPLSGTADSISVALTDGDQIAASDSADVTDQSNNKNILALMDIKNQNVVGDMTLTGAFAHLVSSVGSSVSTLKGSLQTSGGSLTNWQAQQQSVSGVDINEEYVNLQMYSQYYQANAQVLKTATSMFDTLLSIR